MPRNEWALSKSYIEGLRPSPDGKRLYYYDTKLRGLELVVNRTGAKSFSVYKWVAGKARRVVLGHYNGNAIQPQEFNQDPLVVLENNPGLTVEHARILAQAVIQKLSAGETPKRIKRKPKEQEIKLGELFEEYINKYAMEHTKTWPVMQACFDRYLGTWKDRPVKEITRRDVQVFVNQLGKTSGHTTANRALELLRAVINKGKRWSMLDCENPASGVTKFKLKARRRFVSEFELPRLIKAIYEEPNDSVRDYVLLSLSIGARKTNMLQMRWDQLDLEQGMWNIPETKNGTSQDILLTESELNILRHRFENRISFEWVFVGPSPTKPLNDPKKGWKRILKRAGISDLHLHDLRRTLGSYMAMTGASLSVIGNALNHKEVSTTRKVYAQSAQSAERAARARAHAVMFNTVPPADECKIVELAKQNIRGVEF
jgi:integrase